MGSYFPQMEQVEWRLLGNYNRPLLVTTNRVWSVTPHGFLKSFRSYFLFLLFLYIYSLACTSFTFVELMIKKNPKQFVSKSRCLYDSWIRVVFAKVLMLCLKSLLTSYMDL